MSNDIPKVSISLPVYDNESSIRRTLDSLVNQEFTDFEMIISDDCSTADSVARRDHAKAQVVDSRQAYRLNA